MVLKKEVSSAEEVILGFDIDIVRNTWDGKTLHIAHPEAIASHTAHTSEFTQDMVAAFGKISDPTLDKFFRLCDLEDRGFIKVRGNMDWQPGTYKSGIKLVFSTVFYRLLKYDNRGFTIMLQSEEWKSGKLTEIVAWLDDNEDDSDTDNEGNPARGVY